MIGSVNRDTKLPSNYHWPTDTADNVDYDTVARRASRLCEAVVRRLGRAPSSAARPQRDRVLARRDLARELRPPRARASSRPTSGPGVDPQLARQLVAAHERRAAGPSARQRSAAPRSSRASSRWASIASSAPRPRVARRSATESSVTSTSTGSQARR